MKKFVKSLQVNLFLAGFSHLKPMCEAEAGVANHPVYASGKADYIVLIVRVKEPFMFYFVCELCRQANLQFTLSILRFFVYFLNMNLQHFTLMKKKLQLVDFCLSTIFFRLILSKVS